MTIMVHEVANDMVNNNSQSHCWRDENIVLTLHALTKPVPKSNSANSMMPAIVVPENCLILTLLVLLFLFLVSPPVLATSGGAWVLDKVTITKDDYEVNECFPERWLTINKSGAISGEKRRSPPCDGQPPGSGQQECSISWTVPEVIPEQEGGTKISVEYHGEWTFNNMNYGGVHNGCGSGPLGDELTLTGWMPDLNSPIIKNISGSYLMPSSSSLGIWHLNLFYHGPGGLGTARFDYKFVTVGSLADLTITSITSPTTGEAGGSIPTQVIIKNQGALDAGAFGLAFLLSKDASITLSDINTGIGCSFNSLAKGASYSCSGSIKIPESTPDGLYYFGAYVDSGQHITESNEANNGLAADNSIKIGGDATWVELFPTAVSGPATAVAGGMIDVSAQVVNQGALDAKQFWLDFFLSTDKAIELTDLNTVYGCYYNQLAAGSDDTCSLSILIPPYTPNGSYYLGVYADSLQKVTEFDELNNGLAANAPISISGGDEPFWDVPPSNWAYWYIHAMRDAGITTGCGNGNFCPTGLVTRDQMAAFLVRAIEGDPQSNLCAAGSPFSDVPWNVWYCSHVKRLVDQAITGGCGQGKYCPGNLVTREQMAAFIVRAKEGEPPQNYCGGVAPFKDVPASAWSCGYIKKLVELGVTQGCGNGNYCPTASVTREQMAAFLARAFLGMD